MIRLIAIVGPTATGKTRLAVEAARELGSEIVSVDSRQVYRGLDIGSGKDLGEYRQVSPPVPVHMIDIADPGDVYSVFHYQRDCYRLFAECARKEPFADATPLVMAGGTGLYLEAVLKGFRIPDVPEDRRLREKLMRLGRDELITRLRRENPSRAARTDLSTKKRVVRALEIAGRERRGAVTFSEPPAVAMEAKVFSIDIDRKVLHQRIDIRLDERLAGGLIDEVKRLLDGGLPPARLMQLGLEYREVTAYLTGKKDFDGMVADLRHGIHRFARRQQIWFRGMERRGVEVTWIPPGDMKSLFADL